MDAEFAENVLTVGQHGMDRYKESVGYLLVALSTHDGSHNFLLTFGERVSIGSGGHIIILWLLALGNTLFKQLYSRHEEVVLHMTMLAQVILATENVEEDRIDEFCCIRGVVVFDNEVF